MSELGEHYIWIDPSRKCGAPCLYGHRLEAQFLAEIYWHGNRDMADICSDYEIEPIDVLMCCWFQATFGSRKWKQRWQAWAKEEFDHFWHRNYSRINYPPQKEAKKP